VDRRAACSVRTRRGTTMKPHYRTLERLRKEVLPHFW